MDATQARRLVQETFQHSFDPGRFERFLKQLLNHFEAKPLKYQGAYIPDAFKDHVASLERIGTYRTPGDERIDLLIIRLTRESKLSRARTALRNYVAHHLKTRDGKDAALVAFVSPSEDTWRFSFVRMEYGTVTKESGKVATTTELTPARRLSYLVGEGESCHTAQSRFLDILRQTAHDPTVGELEAAFSVEIVTKEFFEQYKALFLDLQEELERIARRDKVVAKEFSANHISTADFAKKLMGQIVFLYFLQKKGWLGVERGKPWGTGPRDFLRRLTGGEYRIKGNIFNDILEPLFYDTLATDRGPEAWCGRFKCRIPFLNGGLFEPLGGYDWQATDIVIPDRIFTNADRLPNGDVGSGILDVFDRYNFTVNEAEPLEVEVAIDPEMLGKVFENLLEIRERKSKGSFYTPREIVHHMCAESLVEYLDKALNLRAEPLLPETPIQAELLGANSPRQTNLAVSGSGPSRSELAALIHTGEQAALYEAARRDGTVSYARRLPASVERHAPELDNALASIRVCDPAIGSGAFPVGMMTEIVRARSALTAYLPASDLRTPYVFKRHAIQHCLYGVDIDPGAVEIAKLRLWLSLVVDEDDASAIQPLPNLDYKIVVGNSLEGIEKNLFNEATFNELERRKPLYFGETDRTKKRRAKEAIDGLLAQLTRGGTTFDFEAYFSEVFHSAQGFDVVIGNPPYLGFQGFMEQKSVLEARYVSARGKYDYYVPFIEQGLRCLRTGGVLTYICPTNFSKRDYGRAIRRLLLADTLLLEFIDFGDSQMFEGALNYTGILVCRKARARPGHLLIYRRGSVEAPPALVDQGSLTDAPWVFQDAGAGGIIEKVRNARAVPLGELTVGISEGIVTGENSVFLLGQDEARELGLEKAYVRPCLRGREIRRYAHDRPAEVVIYPYLDDGAERVNKIETGGRSK